MFNKLRYVGLVTMLLMICTLLCQAKAKSPPGISPKIKSSIEQPRDLYIYSNNITGAPVAYFGYTSQVEVGNYLTPLPLGTVSNMTNQVLIKQKTQKNITSTNLTITNARSWNRTLNGLVSIKGPIGWRSYSRDI